MRVKSGTLDVNSVISSSMRDIESADSDLECEFGTRDETNICFVRKLASCCEYVDMF